MDKQDNNNFQSPDFNNPSSNEENNIPENSNSTANMNYTNNVNQENQNSYSQGQFGQSNTAPVNNGPVNNAPVNNAPMNNTPVNNIPVSNTPVNNGPFTQTAQQADSNNNVSPNYNSTGNVTPAYAGKNQAEFTYNGNVSYQNSDGEEQDEPRKPNFFQRLFSRDNDDSSDGSNTSNTPEDENQKSTWAQIRRIAIIVLVVVIAFLAIWGIVDIVNTVASWRNPMSTPQETVNHMLDLVEDDNFEQFETLLDSANISNPQILFNQLKTATADSTGNINSNYVLIRLENGRQLLASLYFDEENNEHRIRSVIEIPADLQEYFSN